jgi:diadenosine tetraphosphate (Ap4A) HIT family hydrolase
MVSCSHYTAEPEHLIFETKFWRVSLAYDQSYLGRGVVDLKRHAASLSELSPAEWTDFTVVVKRLEGAVRRAFGARMFNWTCMMNDAYKEAAPEPHVHWHCRPRYDTPVEMDGVRFLDAAFGHHYDRSLRQEVPRDVRRKIIERLNS